MPENKLYYGDNWDIVSDRISREATLLVRTLRVLALTLHTQVAAECPSVVMVSTDRWDSILTVAAVFAALCELSRETLSERMKRVLCNSVMEELVQVYPEGHAACEDCRQFVHDDYDAPANLAEYSAQPETLFSDSLGCWVVWNLFGHAPRSEEERRLVRLLGGIVVQWVRYHWSDAEGRFGAAKGAPG